MQEKIVYAGTQSPSFEKGSDSLRMLADLEVPTKQVERLTERIGEERLAERNAAVAAYEKLPLVDKHTSPDNGTSPKVATVLVDGGRLQIRGDADRGDHETEVATATGAGDTTRSRHWREDRVGLLLAMDSVASAVDPCPAIPEHFVDPTRILKLARELKPVRLGAEAVVEPPGDAESPAEPSEYQPPEVVERRVLASRQNWHNFAPQVAQAARAMGLLGAARKAFVADGAETNWTVWRRFFGAFVPILDFIHALSYVFAAAMADRKFAEGWPVYVRWIGWVWQGQVEQVIVELAQRQAQLGTPAPDEPETSPRQVVAGALTYLQNHKDKMRYDEYRRQGLPLTSSHIESVIKEVNYRVKGSEKFWTEGGAEAVLQLRADYLSDHQPMADFWQRRQDRQTGQRPYRLAA